MFKKIFITVILLITSLGFSQLSNKHWIPPLHSRSETAIQDHYLYLSTPEVTPFLVTVTDGNGAPFPGSPFSLSQATPVVITIGNGQPTKMFLDIADVNTVVSNSGIIAQGSKDFYASFRMRHTSHAETLISKGRPGIGTSFRLGCMINETLDNRKSFVSSVMATEDNTTVTLSNYDTGVIFTSGTGDITSDSQTFVLNEGQSVVFSGYSMYIENLEGIIGALISSDKPVAVNTGNALGGIDEGRGDFTLDQIVSASQIGTEYIFIEGNGTPEMETPLIVAHEDGTEVFINDDTTPVVTINAGQFYLVPNSRYQGTINRNIYVKTNKPVFAYQLIGGGNDTATSGMNFIPPLSCFFQNSVNIPAVDQIGSTSYTSDLMILTYSNATLTVDGNPVPNTQAQNVLGNTDWVTYRISGVTGDVNVVSTGPLAVGVFGFLGNASGYAGYYSGFGSTPQDSDITVCSVSTANLFDAINGNPGTGGTWTVPVGGAPLNGNIFDATINVPGEYIYSFTKDCNASLTTISVKVNVTIQQAGNAGTNNAIATCRDNAPFDLFTLLGTGAQTGGIWSPALASGTGIFNPAVDTSGTYTYTIPSVGVCQGVSAAITVTNNPLPIISPITDLKECDNTADGNDTNGFVTFNLTTKNNEILGSQSGIVVTYHTDPNDAILGTNAITSIYTNSRIIYVRLTNTSTSCYSTTSFNLVVNPRPVVNNEVTLKQCDTDTDARTDFNLTEANVLISNDATYTFSYHNTQNGAENNTNLVTNEILFNAFNGAVVWARIVNSEGCYRTAKVNLIVSATTIAQSYRYQNEECDVFLNTSDPSGDGIHYFDLTGIESNLTSLFPSSQSYNFSYYLTETDAISEINRITDVTNFRNTIPNNQLIWVRMDSNLNNECVGLGPWLELIINPLPIIDLGVNFTLCLDPTTGIGSQLVDATPTVPGNYSYTWTPANPNGNSPIYDITVAGTYSVIVTNTITGCSETDSVTATFSSEPESVYATLITPAFSIGLSTITATAVGGFGTYEYSLNAIDWQSSPIFPDLPNGSYSIYVRDIQGCGLLQTNIIQTITYQNYFTPNNDGYNDKWNIYLPESYEGVIYIYDRYGKLLKQISPYGESWDGTYNGNLLPSTDYWFKVEYLENNQKKEFRSHFSLKR
ncbi:T9SS type B sorting domain-containing protein [Flavobacterium sasangense]|uniref:T9SS type B sorting domain-containing protein n=1 Tax=Flavobacterium sasangense TaxID=503361 RepID=UPI00047EF810|nr:T9SS type B sorting domain-containing protein [Flavobacterium sasangense]